MSGRPSIATDLDATLLDRGGVLIREARAAVRDLRAAGVAVALMSSKTRREMEGYLELLGCDLGSFENGASLLVATPEGTRAIPLPGAVELVALRLVRDRLAARLALPLPSLDELSDVEAHRLTSLEGEALAAARDRRYSLPLVAAPGDDGRIRAALDEPGLSLTRGGTFLHLTGVHDKSGAVRELLSVGLLSRPLLAFGDAPNDLGMLRLADIAVIVPRENGPDPELVAALPLARLAPEVAGRGWAAAALRLRSEGFLP